MNELVYWNNNMLEITISIFFEYNWIATGLYTNNSWGGKNCLYKWTYVNNTILYN